MTTVSENLYPLLAGVCGVLLGAGAVLLVEPGLVPAVGTSPLPEWVLPVVLLGVGGSLLMLLAIRGLL